MLRVDVSTLRSELERAPDLDAACQAVATALVDRGALEVRAYVARAGRLRALATAGVSHVLDGVPAASGPVGRTLRSGLEVQEHHHSSGTLIAVCVPVRAGQVVAGVLAVSSDEELSADDVEAARGAATLLGERIDELGGPPGEGPASRLAQHAAALAGLEDPRRIEQAALIAALDLAGMESAVIAREGDTGPLHVACAAGPLARPLAALTPTDLAALAALVADGSSATFATTGHDPALPLPPGLRAIAGAGARTTVVAPLIARGRHLGVLAVADSRELRVPTDQVELIELIAMQAAACLRTAAAVADLRHRAATDPLTGLGHRGAFQEALGQTHRRPASTAVVLCDIDFFKERNDRLGHQEGDRALRTVAEALGSGLRRGDGLYRLGGDEFAALLAVRGEDEALVAAQRMRIAVAASGADLTVSVGVAVSGPDEPDDALVGRADRALYDAKARGRDAVVLAPAAGTAAPAPGA